MKLLYVVAKAEYFLSHRLSLAKETKTSGFDVAVATTQFNSADLEKVSDFKNFLVKFERGGLNFFKELKTIFLLYRVFKKFKPSLVHNIALKPSLYGALVARICGIRSVNSINGFGYIFTSDHLKAKILRPAIKLAIKYILNSPNVCIIVQNRDDYLVCKELLSKSTVELVAGSGVDVRAFYPVKRESIKNFTFTLVGRMLWTKGVGEFVEAARLFRKGNANCSVRFLLVGLPDIENPETIAEDTLRKWSHEGVIEWLGHINEIQKIYSETHVAVLPSYREGLPKSLLEAMACGLPIITTNAIGCKDIVSEGNGIKVPVGNVGSLKKAFEQCVKDKASCNLMGKKGRELSEKRYSSEIINKNTIDIYNKILMKF